MEEGGGRRRWKVKEKVEAGRSVGVKRAGVNAIGVNCVLVSALE